MSNVNALQVKLKEMGYRLGGVSRDPESNASPDEIAGEILRCLEAIERGDYEEDVLMYDSNFVRAETGMTEEEIETDPEEFKRRYREHFYRGREQARDLRKVALGG